MTEKSLDELIRDFDALKKSELKTQAHYEALAKRKEQLKEELQAIETELRDFPRFYTQDCLSPLAMDIANKLVKLRSGDESSN